MLEYEVTNTRKEAVTVDGLDVLPPESTISYHEGRAEEFFRMRGLRLTQDNLPTGVELTVVATLKGDK